MKTKLFVLITLLWANIVLGKNNQFADFFNVVESLTADFSQTTYNAEFVLTNSTLGSLAFQRPQQLRWHTTKPSEQILLLNDNKLWQIDTELEQAVLQEKKDLSKTPLYWFINKPDTIKSMPKFSHTAGGIDWYLTTNPDNQPVEFGFVNNLLYAITLKDDLGGLSSIAFENLVVNPSLQPKVFELNINPSFDVVK